jgi:hypothetical protein
MFLALQIYTLKIHLCVMNVCIVITEKDLSFSEC